MPAGPLLTVGKLEDGAKPHIAKVGTIYIVEGL